MDYVFGRAGSRFNYIGPVSAIESGISQSSSYPKSLESLNDQNYCHLIFWKIRLI